METQAIPGILTAERLSDGIVVKFADKTCVFYSARLLYLTAPQAQALDEDVAAW